MSRLIKILPIDPDYRSTYFILRSQLTIKTPVTLQTAVHLLKNEHFNLILSEPHNKAILNEQSTIIKSSSIIPEENLSGTPPLAVSGQYGPFDIIRKGNYSDSMLDHPKEDFLFNQ
jgi:hypothetical protein